MPEFISSKIKQKEVNGLPKLAHADACAGAKILYLTGNRKPETVPCLPILPPFQYIYAELKPT